MYGLFLEYTNTSLSQYLVLDCVTPILSFFCLESKSNIIITSLCPGLGVQARDDTDGLLRLGHHDVDANGRPVSSHVDIQVCCVIRDVGLHLGDVIVCNTASLTVAK